MDGEVDGGANEILVTCEYKGEMHVLDVTKETTMKAVFCDLHQRWPDVDPASTRLQYEAPVEKMLISLLKDADIENMIRLHRVSKSRICNIVASPISTREKRRR